MKRRTSVGRGLQHELLQGGGREIKFEKRKIEGKSWHEEPKTSRNDTKQKYLFEFFSASAAVSVVVVASFQRHQWEFYCKLFIDTSSFSWIHWKCMTEFGCKAQGRLDVDIVNCRLGVAKKALISLKKTFKALQALTTPCFTIS